jgi:glutaminyl-peptide cyclotransferase
MKTLASVLTLPLLVAAFGAGGCRDEGETPAPPGRTAPVAAAQVLRSFPHDPQAFTQGLVVDGDTLVESTGGRGRSTIRKVLLESGEVIESVPLAGEFFGEGATVLGQRVYQLTWQENTGFVYDLATLEPEGSFRYEGEGWGLTTDGSSLIVSDGSNVLQFLDPTTHQVKRTLAVTDGGEPIHFLNELEWVRGEIWANVWHQDQIARIDPRTGSVLAWLDVADLGPPIRDQNPEAVPNGIAFDERTGRLFVTGKLWPVLYEIGMPAPAPAATAAATAE